MELIHLVNSVIIFLSHITLLRWLTSLLVFLWFSLSCSFWFLSSDAFICSTVAFPPCDHALTHSQFPLTFSQTQNRMLLFIVYLMTNPVVIWTVFMIIWEMFHGKISLNSLLLLLLVNFVSNFSRFIYIRSSLTHLHGFQLHVLLP